MLHNYKVLKKRTTQIWLQEKTCWNIDQEYSENSKENMNASLKLEKTIWLLCEMKRGRMKKEQEEERRRKIKEKEIEEEKGRIKK